jgi:hypothetical protein
VLEESLPCPLADLVNLFLIRAGIMGNGLASAWVKGG